MIIIVYSRTIGGHHLEYMHHVYEMARSDQDNQYIFALPQKFELLKNKLEWLHADNIKFDLFEDIKHNISASFVTLIKESWQVSKILRSYVKKHDADIIFCNYLIVTIPTAPLLIPKKCRLIGIIYKIYLYEQSGKSILYRGINRFIYFILSKSGKYKSVFILNDEDSAKKLNCIYHTNKFLFLPDPYVAISPENLPNFRKENGIDKSKVVFAHFGAMTDVKSTLEILHSIISLSQEIAKAYCFVFAGVVQEEIREQFYSLLERAKLNAQIIVHDRYCSYEEFASLCIACNAILTPYKRTSQSSGLIGYASQFHKPVVAVKKGLLGILVSKFNLGLLIDKVDDDSLIEAYSKIAAGVVKVPTSDYCEWNSVSNFQKAIISVIKS